jgi:hypothetical protein
LASSVKNPSRASWIATNATVGGQRLGILHATVIAVSGGWRRLPGVTPGLVELVEAGRGLLALLLGENLAVSRVGAEIDHHDALDDVVLSGVVGLIDRRGGQKSTRHDRLPRTSAAV